MREKELKNLTEKLISIIKEMNSIESEKENPKSIAFLTIVLEVIIVIGLVGNSMNIFVFSKASMRQVSTFRFLLYLSIADLFVLIICSTDALFRFGYNYEIRSRSLFICRLHTFMTYFLTHISSIILMVVSIDRALIINSNSKRLKLICCCCAKRKVTTKYELVSSTLSNMNMATVINQNQTASFSLDKNLKLSVKKLISQFFNSYLHKVDIVLVLIGLLLGILNSHYLFFLNINELRPEHNPLPLSNYKKYLLNQSSNSLKTSPFQVGLPSSAISTQLKGEVVDYICFPLEDTAYYVFLNKLWIWVDLCVYSLIPFMVMSVCSISILIEIRKKSKKFLQSLKQNQNEINKVYIYRRVRRNRQVFYMLLITDCYFFLSLCKFLAAFIL
jgi:hypothetical protein